MKMKCEWCDALEDHPAVAAVRVTVPGDAYASVWPACETAVTDILETYADPQAEVWPVSTVEISAA